MKAKHGGKGTPEGQLSFSNINHSELNSSGNREDGEVNDNDGSLMSGPIEGDSFMQQQQEGPFSVQFKPIDEIGLVQSQLL